MMQEVSVCLALLFSISDSKAHTGPELLLKYFVDLDFGTETADLHFDLLRFVY